VDGGTIDVSYSANTGLERTGTIQVGAKDPNGKSVTGSPAVLTINQFPPVGAASVLTGKGEWIWKISDALTATGSANIQELLQYEINNGINYVVVKAGEGNNFYGNKEIFINLVGLARQLSLSQPDKPLKVFGFHYVYGGSLDAGTKTSNFCENTDPVTEGNIAITILQTGVDGLVIDAELKYFDNNPSRILCNGKPPPMKAATAALKYITTIRNNTAYTNAFLAHSPFPIPTSPSGLKEAGPLYDTPFPFMTFGENTQAVLPQTYYRFWDQNQTPNEIVHAMNTAWITVQKSWTNNKHSNAVKPIFPIGYGNGIRSNGSPVCNGNTTNGQDITDFISVLKTINPSASESGYTGVSFFRTECQSADIWNAIAA
jgi:hypothetical protein